MTVQEAMSKPVLESSAAVLLRTIIVRCHLSEEAHDSRAHKAAMMFRDNPTHHTIAFRDDFMPDTYDIFYFHGFDQVRDYDGKVFAY